MGCFATEVVSLEVPRRSLSEVRSVKLLGSHKSGHSTRSDRPTVKILTMVIMAEDGHAECCLNWNVYNIGVICEFKIICMQKMNIVAKISCYF